MPFPKSWVEEKIQKALSSNRLAHAYLLSGESLEELETLFHSLASMILGDKTENHPDLHIVRPLSKTRRIVIDQIRKLEQPLCLKPYRAPYKVAAIVAADRMCIGSAEPANAFLKTLEEPPAQTIIFLLSENPDSLLPTILSRCLWLPIKSDLPPAHMAEADAMIQAWKNVRLNHPADRAYQRAASVTSLWAEKKSEIEASYKTALKEADQSGGEEELETKALEAQIESDFIQWRDRILKHLLQHMIKMPSSEPTRLLNLQTAHQCVEELRAALGRNLDPAFAMERCCLKMEGLIH